MAAIYLPPWRIDIAVRPLVELPLARASLARLAARALKRVSAPQPASLGFILTDDRELAGLNSEHMGQTGPTDVLSFPLLPPAAFPSQAGRQGDLDPPAAAFALPPGARPHLGDVVISVERAVEQAHLGRGGQTGDVRWSAADELRLLVVHGTLHICGWDHADEVEGEAMRALERDLLGEP